MDGLRSKLSGDLLWTMGSFAILAASGIIINIAIASLRDATALGVFNLAFAVLIVTSQIATFGLHYSVLRHTALHRDDEKERGELFATAALASLVLGVATASAVYLAAPFLGRLFDSAAMADATAYIALSLVLLPFNKVLLGYLNGLREMRAFAVLQSVRYLGIMGFVVTVAALPVRFEIATLGFLLAEVVTAAAGLVYLAVTRKVRGLALSGSWNAVHFTFGGKSLLSGMFVELNSRVDVLMIGLFLPVREVGIYSFAAMLVEGLYQILVVVRTNFNPMLVGYVRDKDWEACRRLRRTSVRYIYPMTAVLALGVMAAFWVLTDWMLPEKGLQSGIFALAILLTGLTVMSVFVPFDNLLMVTGHPGHQTVQHLAIVVTNIVCNALLVPYLGIEGAALATALSYLAGIVVLTVMVRRLLNWNLLTNLVAS